MSAYLFDDRLVLARASDTLGCQCLHLNDRLVLSRATDTFMSFWNCGMSVHLFDDRLVLSRASDTEEDLFLDVMHELPLTRDYGRGAPYAGRWKRMEEYD